MARPARSLLVRLAPLLLVPPLLLPAALAEAGQDQPAPAPASPAAATPGPTVAPPEPCGACTGSLVKAWRIRNGDPKHPAPTKSLSKKDKDAGSSDLAD